MIFDWAPVGGVIVDLLIIGGVGISTYLAYHKGLVDLVTKILAFIIAIVITLILFKPVSLFLSNHTGLKPFFSDKLKTVLSSTSLSNAELIDESQSNLPKKVIDFINNQAGPVVEQGGEAVINTVSDSLAAYIVKLIAALVIFIIIRLALIYVQSVLSLFSKLPLVGLVNKLGGAAYGFLRAIIIICFILLLLSIFATMIGTWNIMYAVQSSKIGGYLYNHNIIMNLFSL